MRSSRPAHLTDDSKCPVALPRWSPGLAQANDRRLCLATLAFLGILPMALAGSLSIGPLRAAETAAAETAAPETPASETAIPKTAVPELGTRPRGVDWPCFLGPTYDNKSVETGFKFAWSETAPRLVWSRALGESYGIGSVSRGRYFQFDYVDNRHVLLCLHSETGKLIWQFAYDSDYEDLYNYSPGPRTTPFVDDERVYIQGVEGRLFCIDVRDGDVIWQLDTETQYGVIQNFFGVGSSPIVHGDLLIAMVGGSPAEDQTIPPGQLDRVRGNGTAIVALDKRTGKEQYRLSNELASYATPTIVSRPDRDWGFAFLRGGLLVFEPQGGRQDFFFPWRAKSLESVNASTPIVWDDYVFISETYGPGAALLRFRPSGHDLVWQDDPRRRDKAMQTHWNTPIYHEGYLYGSSGRHASNAELRCIEALSGKVQWSIPGLTRASLLYVDGHFVCLSEDGTLRTLRANPKQFELVAEFTPRGDRGEPLLKYPAWAAPIVSHGLMYVRGKDRLLCYELPTAEPK